MGIAAAYIIYKYAKNRGIREAEEAMEPSKEKNRPAYDPYERCDKCGWMRVAHDREWTNSPRCPKRKLDLRS